MTDQTSTAAEEKPKSGNETVVQNEADEAPETKPAVVGTTLHGQVYTVGEVQPVATTTDTANLHTLELTDNAAPQLDRPALEQKAKELHDAIHRGGWFFGLNSSPDKEAIARILEPLNKADREALEKVYAEKYPDKGAGALRAELKEKLGDGLEWRKVEAVLNRDDGRTNDAGNVMVALTHMKDDSRAGNAELRAAISTLNSKQIALMREDFQKQYNMSLDDALKSDKIDPQTRQALEILLKGSDKRTADDQVALANLAVDAGDRRLFAEALRGDGAAATEARLRLQQDEAFKERMANAFPSDLALETAGYDVPLTWQQRTEQSAQDYLYEGRISLKTITEGNTGKWIFDNKDNIELAARNAGDKERRDFTLGREIATANPPRQPANDAERQALEFYNKLHDAFKRHGNERDVAIWEDNLVNGRATVITEMARTHKDGYIFGLFGAGHTRQEIISSAENLSKQDWEMLRSDKGDAFLKQIEESLQGYADPGERERIMQILKAKREAPTYEQSQQVHRTIRETIEDNRNKGWFSDSYRGANIVPNIARMSPAEAAEYQRNPAELDQFVEKNLTGVEQVYARRLLDEVKRTGQPPKEDAINRMFSLDVSKGKPEDILRAAEQAIKEDPTLLDRMNKPWDQLTKEEKLVRIVIENAVARGTGEAQSESSYLTNKVMESFLKLGRFTPEQQMRMGFPRKDVIPQMAVASQEERDAAMRFLSPAQKQVLQEIMNNPDQKPTLADRMRLFASGSGGAYTDFKEELQGLTYEQRQQLKEEYQRKYGRDLDNEFLSKVDEKDKGAYKDLLTPASLDGRQRFFDNYMQMIKSDSGFSPDASQLTLERASDLHATSLEEYQKIYKTLPPEKQQALDAFFNDALKQYQGSKEKLAEVLVDATITAAALAATPFTGGASLTAVVAIAAASGAAFRVAAMKAIVGTDYDTDKVFADLVKGGTTAALNFLTFGAGSVATKVGGNVAEKMVATFGDDVLSQAGRQLIKTELPELVAKYGTKIPDEEMAKLVSRLAAEGATPAQRAALEKALRDGVTNGWTAEMQSLMRLAKDSARNAAEGGLANAGGEVAYALVDPKYDFSNFTLSTGVGIVVGGLMPIGLRGLKAGKDAIVNFRPNHEPGVPGRSTLDIYPADQSGPVTVRHADGSTTTLRPGEPTPPYRMKPGDQIIDAPEKMARSNTGSDTNLFAPGATRTWQRDTMANPFAPHKDYSLRIGNQEIPVTEQRITFGRSSDNAIRSERDGISRHHAQVQFTDKGPVISDLNSLNGTYVNGRQLGKDEQLVLKPGDKIRLGKTGEEYTWGEKFRGDAYRAHAIEMNGQQHGFNKDTVVLGRDTNNSDIVFSDTSVSRQHAQIRFDGDGAHIKDLGSYNGTYVNGRKLQANEEVVLKPGDRVTMGDSEFIFRERQAAGVDLTAPRRIAEYNPRNGDNAARPEAVRQSNAYEQQREMWEPLENGWQRVSRGAQIGPDGNFTSRFPSTVVDRTQDKVLNETVNEAMQRYRRLAEEAANLSRTNPTLAAQKYQELARELAEFSKTKMHPRGWSEEMVDNAYDQFYDANAGKRILLGDYIDQAARGTGAGVCSQQAILFKVLVDEFNAKIPGFQMRAGLVHGNYGDAVRPGHIPSMNHAWNEVEINGQRLVYDPRQQHYGLTYDQLPSHHPGRDFVAPQHRDAHIDLRQHLQPNQRVSYDGRQWKVRSVDADGAVIAQNGIRETSVADFMRLNPNRRLEIGQRYTVMRSSGQREEGWLFQGYNQDGSLRFFKEDAIQMRVSRSDLMSENSFIGGRGERAVGKVDAQEITNAQNPRDIGDLAYRIKQNNQTDMVAAVRTKIMDQVKTANPADYQLLRDSANALGIKDEAFTTAMRQREAQLIKENLNKKVFQEQNPTRDVYTGSVNGFNETRVMAKVDGPGEVNLTHLYRGDLSPGMGSNLLAETLMAHNIIPTRKLTLSMINENQTRALWKAGGRPEDSVIGKSALRALEQMGLKPKGMRWVEGQYGSLSIVVDMQ